MMDYNEIINFLYNQFPVFEKAGGDAYKPGLERIEALCHHFGNPQRMFKGVHIAGTNGKGSSSHMLASVMQAAGYKTGLYTSPHLKSFTERIRINGVEISKEEITNFVNENLAYFKSQNTSFFEIVTLLAFHFFAKEKVDIAIIETGLGGRLDATNVIMPEVTLITNIGYDHMQYLGDTLEKIAFEKAGIMKEGIPMVIGEKQNETSPIYKKRAVDLYSKLIYAEDFCSLENIRYKAGKLHTDIKSNQHYLFKDLVLDLAGIYQEKNIRGVLTVLDELTKKKWTISEEAVRKGLSEVTERTGLKGRWQILQSNPTILCDTAHNESGIKMVIQQLKTLSYEKLYVVLGMVKDKEIETILSLMPKEAYYFFTMPPLPRALEANSLFEKAKKMGLKGEVEDDISKALAKAKLIAKKEDLIFVGGSTFVVAEVI